MSKNFYQSHVHYIMHNSQEIFLFFISFLLGYIHYREGFIVTILIRFILYIIYIAPILSPPQLPPAPHKAIARSFLVLFHTDI
jgi:hypothetical protein